MPSPKNCVLLCKLVEDLEGMHVYILYCPNCGKECGDEFTIYHASAGKTSDPVPVMRPSLCVGRQRVVVNTTPTLRSLEAEYSSMVGVANG